VVHEFDGRTQAVHFELAFEHTRRHGWVTEVRRVTVAARVEIESVGIRVDEDAALLTLHGAADEALDFRCLVAVRQV
jgi:hypothetical protein